MSFLFINKTLRLNNLKTKTAMNAKVSVLFLCVETIIYFLWYNLHDCNFKGALSGLRQHLATASPLTMMKNTFYFTSKALFVLKIFKFLYWLFGHVAKRPDHKDQVNVKFYDVTAWLTKNLIHIMVIHILSKILRSKGYHTMKFVQLIGYNMKSIFLAKIIHRMWWKN